MKQAISYDEAGDLVATVMSFIEKNKISCPETICQCDWVLENAPEFIGKLCEIVGYYEYEEEE